MKAGDFSTLAEAYAKYRPDYSAVVLHALDAIVSPKNMADVGAGTGIWTSMVHSLGVRVSAVEPNDQMRAQGKEFTKDSEIEWLKGSAEETGLTSGAFDWVTMASSFHWADLKRALTEFSRLLVPRGYLTVLWNPRDIDAAPLHQEIEQALYSIVPELQRVSSGDKKHVRDYTQELVSTGEFTDALFIEAPHTLTMTRERYIGAWRSVNDVQQQAGPERFQQFLNQVEKVLGDSSEVIVPYKTRSWTVRKTS